MLDLFEIIEIIAISQDHIANTQMPIQLTKKEK